MHRMALHALVAHPDVGLDVLHDVADMEGAIGVGQRRGDEKGAHREGRNSSGELGTLSRFPAPSCPSAKRRSSRLSRAWSTRTPGKTSSPRALHATSRS